MSLSNGPLPGPGEESLRRWRGSDRRWGGWGGRARVSSGSAVLSALIGVRDFTPMGKIGSPMGRMGRRSTAQPVRQAQGRRAVATNRSGAAVAPALCAGSESSLCLLRFLLFKNPDGTLFIAKVEKEKTPATRRLLQGGNRFFCSSRRVGGMCLTMPLSVDESGRLRITISSGLSLAIFGVQESGWRSFEHEALRLCSGQAREGREEDAAGDTPATTGRKPLLL